MSLAATFHIASTKSSNDYPLLRSNQQQLRLTGRREIRDLMTYPCELLSIFHHVAGPYELVVSI